MPRRKPSSDIDHLVEFFLTAPLASAEMLLAVAQGLVARRRGPTNAARLEGEAPPRRRRRGMPAEALEQTQAPPAAAPARAAKGRRGRPPLAAPPPVPPPPMEYGDSEQEG